MSVPRRRVLVQAEDNGCLEVGGDSGLPAVVAEVVRVRLAVPRAALHPHPASAIATEQAAERIDGLGGLELPDVLL